MCLRNHLLYDFEYYVYIDIQMICFTLYSYSRLDYWTVTPQNRVSSERDCNLFTMLFNEYFLESSESTNIYKKQFVLFVIIFKIVLIKMMTSFSITTRNVNSDIQLVHKNCNRLLPWKRPGYNRGQEPISDHLFLTVNYFIISPKTTQQRWSVQP